MAALTSPHITPYVRPTPPQEAADYSFMLPLYLNAPGRTRVALMGVCRTLLGIARQRSESFMFFADVLEDGCDATISVRLAGRHPKDLGGTFRTLVVSSTTFIRALELPVEVDRSSYWHLPTHGSAWCRRMAAVGCSADPADESVALGRWPKLRRPPSGATGDDLNTFTRRKYLAFACGHGSRLCPLGDLRPHSLFVLVTKIGWLMSRDDLCDVLMAPGDWTVDLQYLDFALINRLDEGLARLLVPHLKATHSSARSRTVIKDDGALRVFAAAGLSVCGTQPEDCNLEELMGKVRAGRDPEVAKVVFAQHTLCLDVARELWLIIPQCLVALTRAFIGERGKSLKPLGGDAYLVFGPPSSEPADP